MLYCSEENTVLVDVLVVQSKEEYSKKMIYVPFFYYQTLYGFWRRCLRISYSIQLNAMAIATRMAPRKKNQRNGTLVNTMAHNK